MKKSIDHLVTRVGPAAGKEERNKRGPWGWDRCLCRSSFLRAPGPDRTFVNYRCSFSLLGIVVSSNKKGRCRFVVPPAMDLRFVLNGDQFRVIENEVEDLLNFFEGHLARNLSRRVRILGNSLLSLSIPTLAIQKKSRSPSGGREGKSALRLENRQQPKEFLVAVDQVTLTVGLLQQDVQERLRCVGPDPFRS